MNVTFKESFDYRVKTLRRFSRNPEKLVRLATSSAGLKALRYAVRPPKHGALAGSGESGIGSRNYANYDDYVRHQRSKLGMVDLADYDPRFRTDLARRLADQRVWNGASVLCLAARIGTEVRAFHDVGAFAVGIDLEPGKDNEWVLPGDFHNLIFPDASVDGVYCNSLDHALDLPKTLTEARRVLKASGRLLVDAQYGSETDEFDDWAATSWATVDSLLNAIEDIGFILTSRSKIEIPQPGEQLLFIVKDSKTT